MKIRPGVEQPPAFAPFDAFGGLGFRRAAM